MRLTEEGPIGDLQAHAMPLRPMPRRARLRLTVTRMRGEQLPACVHEIRVYES